MREPADLLDQFTELVLGADQPRRLADRTMEVVVSMMSARSAGVFSVADDKVTLYASRGIDQSVLDAMETVWKRHRESLRSGSAFLVPNRRLERRLPEGRRVAPGATGFLIMPVFDGETLVALLYLDSDKQDFSDEAHLARLAKFSRILVKAVTGRAEEAAVTADVEAYLAKTPDADIERQRLLLALSQTGWNIARAARALGVTRRTVYMRLARYKVERPPSVRGRPRLEPANT